MTETTCDIINLFDSPDEFEECKDTFSCKRPRIHDSLKTDVKSSQSSPNLCPKNVQLNANDEESNQPPTPSSSNVHSSQNRSNSSINTSSKKESPVNDLLNLNLNDKRSPQVTPPSQSGNSQQPQQNQRTIPCDLLGNFNAQNIDLLNDLMSGDKSSQQRRSTNTSNLDLLNELFHGQTNVNGGQSHGGNGTASSGPDLLSEPTGARANENPRNNQTNHLDPFEELFGGSAGSSSQQQQQPSTSNGLRFPLNSTQPPLKPTQTKPTTSHAKSNNIPKFTSSSSGAFQRPQKPDYNRAYFNEPPPSNSNGPKLAQDAFGDLLGDFTKNTQGDWSKNGKPMAQLKREEMVSRPLVFSCFLGLRRLTLIRSLARCTVERRHNRSAEAQN